MCTTCSLSEESYFLETRSSEIHFLKKATFYRQDLQKTAMIGLRERERTKERRLCGAKATIFFLWVILVFALISLFLSIHNESSSSSNSSSGSRRSSQLIRPPTPPPRRERRSFSRSLFHAPSRTIAATQPKFVATNSDPDTFYEDDKRVIHTGPNPLHN